MDTCPEHGAACAYTGREADRCPWCHCLWSHVIRSGFHSCEIATRWDSRIRTERVQAARWAREAAAKVGRGPEQPARVVGGH